MRAVDSVLAELGAGEKPRLLVFNKADLLDSDERHNLLLAERDAILASALSGEGVDELRDQVEKSFEDTLASVEYLIPYSAGARLHELHELAGELDRTDRSDGVLVRAKVPTAELHRFADLSVNGASAIGRSDDA